MIIHTYQVTRQMPATSLHSMWKSVLHTIHYSFTKDRHHNWSFDEKQWLILKDVTSNFMQGLYDSITGLLEEYSIESIF